MNNRVWNERRSLAVPITKPNWRAKFHISFLHLIENQKYKLSVVLPFLISNVLLVGNAPSGRPPVATDALHTYRAFSFTRQYDHPTKSWQKNWLIATWQNATILEGWRASRQDKVCNLHTWSLLSWELVIGTHKKHQFKVFGFGYQVNPTWGCKCKQLMYTKVSMDTGQVGNWDANTVNFRRLSNQLATF